MRGPANCILIAICISNFKRLSCAVNNLRLNKYLNSDLDKSLNCTYHLQHHRLTRASGWTTLRGGSLEQEETEYRSRKFINFLLMPSRKICKTDTFSTKKFIDHCHFASYHLLTNVLSCSRILNKKKTFELNWNLMYSRKLSRLNLF